MYMELSNFMLPTQASGAIVIDGSILILLGAIIVGYYLIKMRSSMFNVDRIPIITSNPSATVNKIVNEEQKIEEHITINSPNVEKIKTNIKKEFEEENIYIKSKEIVFNRR